MGFTLLERDKKKQCTHLAYFTIGHRSLYILLVGEDEERRASQTLVNDRQMIRKTHGTILLNSRPPREGCVVLPGNPSFSFGPQSLQPKLEHLFARSNFANTDVRSVGPLRPLEKRNPDEILQEPEGPGLLTDIEGVSRIR